MGRLIFLAAGGVLLLLRPAQAGPALMIDRLEVKIRADATVQSERIADMQQGDEVEQLDQKDEWFKVRLEDGREGWVNSTLVQERLIVTGQGVRIRAAGSSSAPALGVTSRGDELGKLSQQGNWCEVVLPDGERGWISRSYVRSKIISIPPAEKALPPPPQREQEPPLVHPDRSERDTEEESKVLRHNPYAEGLQHESEGNYRAALQNFDQVLEKESGNLNARFHAAQAHKQLGDYDEALEDLYLALEKGGRRRFYLELGEVYRLKGEVDSTRKYKALWEGEEWASEKVAKEGEEELEADAPILDVLWIYTVVGLGAAVVVGLLVALLRRQKIRSRGAKRHPPAKEGSGKFGRQLKKSETRRSEGTASAAEENELDRQIDDKWRELQQSAEVFTGGEPSGSPPEKGLEDIQLNQILSHLETLRKGLEMQDERAHIYADIVRLQNMKIEVMNEELRLLRRRK